MGVPPAKRVEIPQEWLEEIRAKDEFFRAISPGDLAAYTGKWIAMKSGRIVAVGSTEEEVEHRLSELGIRIACTEFIEEPRYVIYRFRQALGPVQVLGRSAGMASHAGRFSED